MITIFQYDFMLRAFAAGAVVGVLAPAIGLFIVSRRYSFIADTLAHVSLAGVAAGYLAGIDPILTAIGASLASAGCVEWLRRSGSAPSESLLSLLLYGGLALAAVLLSLSSGTNVSLSAVLFGSIATVSSRELLVIALLGFFVLTVLIVLFKEFFAVVLDEDLSAAGGVPSRLLNTVLVMLAAVTVSATMRIIGVLLVGALMVIPVLTAMQLGLSFRKTLFASMAFSVTSVVLGLIVSFHMGTASGGTIVLIALGFFLISTQAKMFHHGGRRPH
ncbi:MAG: metal ABC transporter permease [Candidatus Peribacteraceae bacterium]|nr:metal ABC transporter permease [Candidatus Peribacteraceae bacterium]